MLHSTASFLLVSFIGFVPQLRLCVGSIQTNNPTEEPTEEPTKQPTEELDLTLIEETDDYEKYELSKISSFSGVWPYDVFGIPLRPEIQEDDINVDTLYQNLPLFSVNENGKQFLTMWKLSFIQQLVDTINDPDLDLDDDTSNGDNFNINLTEVNAGPSECEINVYDLNLESGLNNIRRRQMSSLHSINSMDNNNNDNNNINNNINIDDKKIRRLQEDDDPLRDISVLGTDDTRTPITGALRFGVATFVGKITTSNGPPDGCTATIVENNWILTAAHCIHAGKDGDWYADTKFTRGLTTDYGGDTPIEVYCTTYWAWVLESDYRYDIAWCTYGSDLGVGRSFYGFGDLPKEGSGVYTFGYPFDLPGEMYGSSTILSFREEHGYYSSTLDGGRGFGGGPMYFNLNGVPIIYGVVSGLEARTSTQKDVDWVASALSCLAFCFPIMKTTTTTTLYAAITRINYPIFTTMCDDMFPGASFCR